MTNEEARGNLFMLYDTVDEEGVIDTHTWYKGIQDNIRESLFIAIKALEQEPKTGHWIMPIQDDGMSDPIYYQVSCSKCGFDLDPQTWHMELHQYDADKYCPNCGARMVGPKESEE